MSEQSAIAGRDTLAFGRVEIGTSFPGPWRVVSYQNTYDRTVYAVRAADGTLVIQPEEGDSHRAVCEAIVRSRNEDTDLDAIAGIEARGRAACAALRGDIERVRAHFHAEIDELTRSNRTLQDAIAEARRTNSTALLPAWCQAGPEPEDADAERLRAALGAERRRSRSLWELLLWLQWDARLACPWCGRTRADGHNPDCRVAAALAPPTSAGPTPDPGTEDRPHDE